MKEFLIPILISISAYLPIYINRKKISNFLGINDLPDGKRKIHKTPVPKTGAFPIAIIILIIVISNFFIQLFDRDLNLLLIFSLFIFCLGLFDDKFNLRARNKIFFIIIISLALCTTADDLIINKFYIHTYDFFFNLNSFGLLFTVICIFTLINSLNLADGINGLAIGLIFFWLMYINQTFNNETNLIINTLLVSLILSFYHNLKQKHFLGDAGSLMLSSFIAFFIIYLYNNNIEIPTHQNSAENILILFLIPVLDMVRLFFERLINKQKPSTADKNHLHHYLIEKMSDMKALIVYFIFLNIPIMTSTYTQLSKIYIIVTVVIVYFLFIFYHKFTRKNT